MMTGQEISEALDEIVRYFARCYLNAANGSEAQALYKRYAEAAGAASYRILKGKARKTIEDAPAVPEVGKWMAVANREYERALKNRTVRKPLAYALYHTWRYVDSKEPERDTKD